MHASKESIILAQWELWNETLYDILIASVSLSPSQMDHVSKSFASTSDGQAFYRWVLSHADNRKESAQIRLKTRLRDLKLTADMSSDQVKAPKPWMAVGRNTMKHPFLRSLTQHM